MGVIKEVRETAGNKRGTISCIVGQGGREGWEGANR